MKLLKRLSCPSSIKMVDKYEMHSEENIFLIVKRQNVDTWALFQYSKNFFHGAPQFFYHVQLIKCCYPSNEALQLKTHSEFNESHLPACLEIKMSFAPGTCFSGSIKVNVMIFNEERAQWTCHEVIYQGFKSRMDCIF